MHSLGELERLDPGISRCKKKVDVFALSIYGLVIFPKALRHIDEVVTDLFDRLAKWATPVPAILVETFRSLNVRRRAEIAATPMRDDISEERWMTILQNLQEKDVEWKAFWIVPDEVLYRCGNFDWVPLLGVWGAVGYAPLLVLRQYELEQFVPATHGLAHSEFLYKGDNYNKRVREIADAWKQTHRMKKLTGCPMTTPEYSRWLSKRINDNIPRPSLEGV
ncbi:uncharacterized protein [Gossypium hirsutum]|uniref:DUF7745 domain-containing protein n=1 Tax=Gossypium hirsutum TaxID=3635 RepID=A0ABM3BNE6_GOSHI|nr:uncharacterized protein LOC121229183 [Gossypium hirsutum]